MIYTSAPASPQTLEVLIRQITDEVLGIEGRYSNNPADAGGETMWGFTKATARALGYNGPMKDLPRTRAVQMYRDEFFIRPGFHHVAALSPKIAGELFEQHVNLKDGQAARHLQRALNALNDGQKLFPDLTPDGNIGPVTLNALGAFLQGRKREGEQVLFSLLNAQQAVYYLERTEARPKNEEFFYGWVKNRTMLV